MYKVLFACVENSCRSQMAEAFFNRYAEGAVARSAGSAPADRIDPKTAEVMGEIGIDISDARPAGFHRFRDERFDLVVTMGCRDVCPFSPGTGTVEWKVEDPKGKGVEKYREVRDMIRRKVKELLAEET